jgi:hypothetical protein
MEPTAARKLRDDAQPDRDAARRRLRLVEAPSPAVRRTIKITGRPYPPPGRRSSTSRQIAARPDRVALWAVLLGLFLVFMAVATAHAAVL